MAQANKEASESLFSSANIFKTTLKILGTFTFASQRDKKRQ